MMLVLMLLQIALMMMMTTAMVMTMMSLRDFSYIASTFSRSELLKMEWNCSSRIPPTLIYWYNFYYFLEKVHMCLVYGVILGFTWQLLSELDYSHVEFVDIELCGGEAVELNLSWYNLKFTGYGILWFTYMPFCHCFLPYMYIIHMDTELWSTDGRIFFLLVRAIDG